MKVLVSGAGGFLGRCVVDRLSEQGHIVRAIIRPESREPAAGCPCAGSGISSIP